MELSLPGDLPTNQPDRQSVGQLAERAASQSATSHLSRSVSVFQLAHESANQPTRPWQHLLNDCALRGALSVLTETFLCGRASSCVDLVLVLDFGKALEMSGHVLFQFLTETLSALDGQGLRADG